MATANLTDMSILAGDQTFQNRVAEALFIYCWNTVPSESITAASVSLHNARKNYAAGVLNNPNTFKPLFVNVVASNQIVANDATTNGTLVGLGSSQVATAAALATDTDITNAVAAAFNAFIPGV